ncbi:hypothetical protein, partial [Pseudomonas sp. FG-3G]
EHCHAEQPQSYRNAEDKENPSEQPAQAHGLSLGEKHSNTKPHRQRDQSRAEPHRSAIEAPEL